MNILIIKKRIMTLYIYIYIYRDDKSKYTKKINVSQKEEKEFGKFVYDMGNGNYLIINWHLLNGKNLKIDSYSLE